MGPQVERTGDLAAALERGEFRIGFYLQGNDLEDGETSTGVREQHCKDKGGDIQSRGRGRSSAQGRGKIQCTRGRGRPSTQWGGETQHTVGGRSSARGEGRSSAWGRGDLAHRGEGRPIIHGGGETQRGGEI